MRSAVDMHSAVLGPAVQPQLPESAAAACCAGLLSFRAALGIHNHQQQPPQQCTGTAPLMCLHKPVNTAPSPD